MKKDKTQSQQLSLFSDADFDTQSATTQEEDNVLQEVKEVSHDTELERKTYDLDALFVRLSRSDFRSSFHLKEKDRQYIREKGFDTIRKHAEDFVSKRLAPAVIPNDGKQTPMKGHPVFLAQHATGCCCRDCFYKWHHIPKGRTLTPAEQQYVVAVLMTWITNEYKADSSPIQSNTRIANYF